MKKPILAGLAFLVAAALVFAIVLTQDGERVVPRGDGIVALDAGEFEAFPLPDHVAESLPDGYQSYFVEVEPGIKVHVLEFGSGLPLLLQHGNPTSGLLYRKVVEQLPTDRVRVILPTLVGLGFSSKVPASEHTMENHIRWLHGVLEQLQLTEVVFAGQDWGGPIGMGALARSPDLLKGIVVLNTFFDAVEEEGDLSPGHAFARRPVLPELLIERMGMIYRNLPQTQGNPDSLPPDVVGLYRDPVVASGNTKATLAMMRMVPDGPDHPTTREMRVIERYVDGLEIPAEIVWGESDPILASQLPAMKRHFPEAPITETQAGHFLQEEVPDEIAAALVRVVDQVHPRATGENQRGDNK